MSDPRRAIPSVEALLESEAFVPVLDRAGRKRVVRELQRVQDALRDALGEDPGGAPDPASLEPGWYAAQVTAALDAADTPSLRRVINATGVVLHTNLGRAPLAEPAIRAMVHVAGYGTLEYDLETGERGSRHDHCVALLMELTGAEDALVVNNNAAAVVLVLNTLAEGRTAVISRGELVEIGGSFRVPEIMARSGTEMREVGATNRTHVEDYRQALADAGLILKVHRSNFRLEGFTAEVEIEELAAIASENGIPLVHDLGSGALLDMTALGLPPEPTAAAALAAGADLVTMSGDKLLGGPQAGIIVGDGASIAAMRSNPLCRAFRPDKLTLAALEATLRLYRDPESAMRDIPALRMLGADTEALEARAHAFVRELNALGIGAVVEPASGVVGGGAYPGVELPGFAAGIDTDAAPDALAGQLRAGEPPVVGRVRDGTFWLDLRTVHPREEEELVAAVEKAVADLATPDGDVDEAVDEEPPSDSEPGPASEGGPSDG
ncbi:MAG: L-seryl-tRNA(Sec) selenium transferase [Candidatus Longimicrobiales bacterium M2_2A_002]